MIHAYDNQYLDDAMKCLGGSNGLCSKQLPDGYGLLS